jgi:hypothetical protein
VVIQGSVPGTGDGSQGGQLAFNPLRENQRTALLLVNGVVYFAFSSHGDNPPYHGWVMGYSAATLHQVLIFCASPNTDSAGIWMDGDGLAADASGNIYFITGDGPLDANNGGREYGDSYVKMSPSGTVLDYFSPSDQVYLANGNLDLGSGGVLLLPDQSGAHPHEMLSAGKDGSIYVVDRDNMGHYNPTDNSQIVQSLMNVFIGGSGDTTGNFSSPVYFNGSVYFSAVSDQVTAFQLSNGLLTTSPTSQSATSFGYPGGTLAISANGNSNGILWAVQRNGSAATGTLHAYDASNLANELYNSNQAGSRDTLGIGTKFSIPLVANGKVFVTSATRLTVFGLLPNGASVATGGGNMSGVQTDPGRMTSVVNLSVERHLPTPSNPVAIAGGEGQMSQTRMAAAQGPGHSSSASSLTFLGTIPGDLSTVALAFAQTQDVTTKGVGTPAQRISAYQLQSSPTAYGVSDYPPDQDASSISNPWSPIKRPGFRFLFRK